MADRNTKIRGSQIFDNGVKFEDLNSEVKVATIGFIIDNGGVQIPTGIAGDFEIPFDCEITEVTLLADQTGSIVVDILKDTYSNYPPTTSITSATQPTISSAIKYKDAVLTGWTKIISAGDTLRVSVSSATTITRCLVNLKIKRT